MNHAFLALLIAFIGICLHEALYLALVRIVLPTDRMSFSRGLAYAIMVLVIAAAYFLVGTQPDRADVRIFSLALFTLFSILCPHFYLMVDHSVRIRISVELHRAPGKKLTYESLMASYNLAAATQRRIDKIVSGGYLVQDGERYRLTPAGHHLATLLSKLKAFMRVPT